MLSVNDGVVDNETAKNGAEKIRDIEEIAQSLEPLRAAGKKVVHCHGVFDLLHVGHIRHFQKAKSSGDVLVVTVTADRHVNKGPHRPAFNEALRAEAVASLGCVDFVGVSRWPTAVEAITRLKPDLYAKGSEYRQSERDYTLGILREREAVEAAGGQVLFTEEITFSSSQLLNRHGNIFPKEVGDYLARLRQRHSAADLIGLLEGAEDLKVLIVGEAILDEYVYCDAIGKSSKEPTLVIKQLDTELFAGGTLAVANNAARFCRNVGLVTFLGAQDSQIDFIRGKLDGRVTPHLLYRKDAPTIVKRRYVENYFFTKMLEIYRINDSVMEEEDRQALHEVLREEIPKYDVVLVVDYGHGMIGDETIDLLCQESRFLVVNAQSNAGNVGYHTIGRYPRFDLACLAEPELRMEARDRRGDLKRLVLSLSKKLGFEKLIVTRGKHGCLAYDGGQGFCAVPAFAGQVVDRIGAGDAFLSVAALCVAQKASVEVAGFLGNTAGAQAVATVGHRASLDKAALYKHVESLLK